MQIESIGKVLPNLLKPALAEKKTGVEFENVFSDFIGSVNKTQLDANQLTEDFLGGKNVELHEVMIAGMQSLKVIRASIKIDFKSDKPFLKAFFDKHGYTEFFSDAKNGDHRSLCKFLKKFAENLTEETRKKITSKNTPDFLFDKIIDCSVKIEKFGECFECMESDAGLNVYGQKEVSEIYTTVQDICRIAMAYYQFDPLKRDHFNFYKVLVNL